MDIRGMLTSAGWLALLGLVVATAAKWSQNLARRSGVA